MASIQMQNIPIKFDSLPQVLFLQLHLISNMPTS